MAVPGLATVALLSIAWCATAQTSTLALAESFDGPLPAWGLDSQGGALRVQGGTILVPIFGVADATVEYRVKVRGEGLVELLFRYDIDTDDYYIFRVDTRRVGGDPPGFLKRYHGDPPWVLVGERSGATPAADQWLQVRVEIAGSKFRGYVNEELVATYEDNEYAGGGLAFRPQVTDGWVDDLRITVPEGGSFTALGPRKPRPQPKPAPFTEGEWTAHWIWSPGEANELSRFFRKSFRVPEPVREATLAVTCDNEYELYLNGERLGGDQDWYSLETYDVARLLRPGRNVLAARCRNSEAGAAGLLLELGAITEAGDFVHVTTDETWKVTKTASEGWASPEYAEEGWENAQSLGPYPGSMWAGQSSLRLPFLGPKQPLELVNLEFPRSITIGRPFKISATWRPPRALTAAYPIILSGRQGGRPFAELSVLQPATPPQEWPVGRPHTETVEAVLWPDAAYFLDPGPVKLRVELRGTFVMQGEERAVGEVLFEASTPAGRPVPPRVAASEPKREGRFTDPTGDEHNWLVDGEGRMVIDGAWYVPLDADGVYWCNAEGGVGEQLAALNWRPVVDRVCAHGGPSGADFVRVRLVDHVDATRTDHEFSEDGGLGGKSRVLQIGGRQYRVSSARPRLSYFAYTMRCEHPRNPHLMMFQSVNDTERYTTVRIQPPWDNVGGGIYTGREYPCDGKPIEHRFIFYPRERDIRLTVSHWPVETPSRPESGAAVSHLWLFELTDPLAARPVQALAPEGSQRRLGMYLTHPGYIYSLYGYRGQDEEERRASLRSFVDYLRFCGINLLEFNAVDGGDTTSLAYYDSKLWPKAAGNLLAELLPICEANDIQVIPIITSLSVPEGKFGFTRDSFQLDRFGEPTIFFGSRPPLPDPLRPEVQDLLIANLCEILDLCAQSPCVPGVGFRVNGKIGLCYGGDQLGKSDQYTGYSAWDISEFEKDTGIDVPEMQPTPYEWLRANCWERWLDWRCGRTRDFWLRCRDVVRSYREDLVLYVSCDMPSETPAWNIYWPEGETPLNCWRYHGVDPRMFAAEKGILLQRGMMVAADRYFTHSGQYARNVEALKAFHYAPGVAELYNGQEGNACELYHNYWEEFGAFKIGEFGTEFWGAATMYPSGRGYFEPVAFSLARTNCHTLNLFSWERGSFGHEHDLRAFARAFRALPRSEGTEASQAVLESTPELWVRRFGDRLAVLNNSGQPKIVTLQYTPGLQAGRALLEFGRYEIIIAASPAFRAEPTVELPLDAWELRVLGPYP